MDKKFQDIHYKNEKTQCEYVCRKVCIDRIDWTENFITIRCRDAGGIEGFVLLPKMIGFELKID